ncbi:sporulation protein [Rhodanobacter thiooxydans]|uniref:Sporulation protein n=1 Tax=Rhodanobacter thiooxydans TaxID=416169 RepID=A0A154QHE7_9GAMM|nr:SPOR domain-containing protein [Rhodanobacter thiooxydans]EIL97775.1 sporulation domain-containing protein [Rhodanobacter thiooxydans LCS2]KZC23418.1 sporulation protein [Rhodanobacter thiooxydans]MCW0200311.1 SPOR domain-containing protein [Rhodanobacter thiooxydans]
MFLRLLFVLLTALNIAVGAWLLLGQPYARGGMPSDPGVTELRLLSELPVPGPAAAATAAIPAAATAAVPAAATPPRNLSYSCLALGPFATPQDLRSARQALSAQTVRMRSRQEQASQTSGWWVYLPSAGSRAQALAVARQLAARNIDDYFVVSAGDQPNTISLGLFKDPANARKRRDEVTAAGFPARMSERSESVPEYWLDLVVADGGNLDWRSRVRTTGVDAHGTGCF